jgi:membrane protease YdiL (CAAX protease family)
MLIPSAILPIASLPSASEYFFELVFLCGLTADVVLGLWLWTRPKLVRPVPWTLPDTLVTYVGVFFLGDGIALLVWELLRRGGVPENEGFRWAVVVGAFIKPLVALLIMTAFFRLRRARPRELFGVTAMPTLKFIGAGLGMFFAVLPPVFIVWFLYSQLARWLPLPQQKQLVVEMLQTETSVPILALLIVTALVIAPLFEEIIFRGYIYPAVKMQLGLPLAAVAVSAGFALMHWNAAAFVPLFLLGLGLTFAYELTGSLWASVVTHMTFNTFFTFLALRAQP